MTSTSKKIELEEPWNELLIDLNAIKSNYLYLRSKLPDNCLFYAVIKSDAYGHGIVEVADTLAAAGCRHFALDTPQEGIHLRKNGFTGEILLLNPIPDWMSKTAIYYNLSVSVIDQSILEHLDSSAESMDRICKIHIAVNVGLNRLGISPSEIVSVAKQASSKSHLQLEGLYGQPRDPTSAKQSFKKLCSIYEKMKSEGIAPKHLHFANSTTFLAHPETTADGVRLGILLYGVIPPEQFSGNVKIPVIPAMILQSRIVQIRELPEGSKIGYRAHQQTTRDSVIATIPFGYAQGLDGRIAGSGFVLINGRKAPFIGPISMNNANIDITDIPDVEIGDIVTLVGKQGDSEISINELAAKAGTISAELMMRFGKGVTRQFVSEKQS